MISDAGGKSMAEKRIATDHTFEDFNDLMFGDGLWPMGSFYAWKDLTHQEWMDKKDKVKKAKQK